MIHYPAFFRVRSIINSSQGISSKESLFESAPKFRNNQKRCRLLWWIFRYGSLTLPRNMINSNSDGALYRSFARPGGKSGRFPPGFVFLFVLKQILFKNQFPCGVPIPSHLMKVFAHNVDPNNSMRNTIGDVLKPETKTWEESSTFPTDS